MLVDTIPKREYSKNNNGVLMLYDNSRNKWLGVCRNSIIFKINNNNITSNRWMMYEKTWSNIQGYNTNRNITITLISVQSKNKSNCKFKIIDDSGDIYSINLNNESKKINDNVNIDVNINNSIKIFLDISHGVVDYPTLIIECAYR